MRAQRIVYAVNHGSGQRRSGAGEEVGWFGDGVEIATGESFEEMYAVTAAALAQPADALVVQGGDGMVSMGAELAAARGLPLGIVPSGTGNDFARTAGIPRGRADHVRVRLIEGLQKGTARFRRVDLLRFTVDGAAHVAVNSLNIGFDALVNERANGKPHLRGTARYLVALLQSVHSFRSDRYRYAFDDAPFVELDAELLSVMNGRTIGGGIPLVPGAQLDDGEFDVITVAGLNRFGLALLFPSAFAGLHRYLPPVSIRRGTTIRIEAPASAPIYADGECIRHSGERATAASLEITVDPGALLLVRP